MRHNDVEPTQLAIRVEKTRIAWGISPMRASSLFRHEGASSSWLRPNVLPFASWPYNRQPLPLEFWRANLLQAVRVQAAPQKGS